MCVVVLHADSQGDRDLDGAPACWMSSQAGVVPSARHAYSIQELTFTVGNCSSLNPMMFLLAASLEVVLITSHPMAIFPCHVFG